MAKKAKISRVRQALRNIKGKITLEIGRRGSGSIIMYRTASAEKERTRTFLNRIGKINLRGRGGKFVVEAGDASFESRNALTIRVKGSREWKKKQGLIGQANVGMNGNSVIVEAIQGVKGEEPWLERFRQSPDNPKNHFN